MNGSIDVKLDMTALAGVQNNIRNGSQKLLLAVAYDGEAHAKINMGPSPSPPGAYPGVDTGTLRAGINVEEIGENEVQLNSSADHSVYLEYGTERMAARPFMQPTARHMAKRGPVIAHTILARYIR